MSHNHLPRPENVLGVVAYQEMCRVPISKISLALLLSTCPDINIAAPISPGSPSRFYICTSIPASGATTLIVFFNPGQSTLPDIVLRPCTLLLRVKLYPPPRLSLAHNKI